MKRDYSCWKESMVKIDDYSLRPVQDEDIESIRIWRNAQLDVLRQKEPITVEQQSMYFEKHIWPSMKLLQPSNILVSFFYKDNLIGYGGLVHISWQDLRAEMSFLLDPKYTIEEEKYSDLFSVYIALLKKMAFEQLGFHRLFTETFEIRSHHISVLEKNGFIREGLMKDHVIISGKYVNSIIHGSINSK
ncbi:MAG TPA: GNAT family protein [Flavobacteriales bacterium]|nr:GNAT family N-acetyltransferase [Flavobacteriales bacterium]HRE73123.1 GNAT family protein [Flavobacteriales bacterium]HRE96042.1 GNAT family protein [Flavobacteriales bacterium]HRJ39614.1 GNAT family protein [Flavobacteriales bacterium]